MALRIVGKLVLALFAFIGGCLVNAAPVAINTETIDIVDCNSQFCQPGVTLPDGTSGFAYVTKTLYDNNTATIMLTLLDNLQLINKGFAFNSTLSLTSASVTIDSSTCSSCTFKSGGKNGQEFAGYGKFNYFIDSGQNGNHGGITSLLFTINGVNNLEQIDQPSSKGSLFAAEVGGIGCTRGACTGFIGETRTVPPVPEPTAIAFFGTGLVAVGMALRRKFPRRN